MNIKTQLLPIALLFVLIGCGTTIYDEEQLTEQPNSTNVKTQEVAFNVNDSHITTRAETTKKTSLSDFFSYLHYWVFDADYSNVITSGVQKSTEAGNSFGKFSAYLSNGTYHVVVVGHNNRHPMKLTQGYIVTIDSLESMNTDTYYGNTECKVTDNGVENTSISPYKNMCMVKVVSKGKPTNVGSLEVALTAYGHKFSVKSGFATNTLITNYSKHTITDTLRNLGKIVYTTYFPLPDAEENTNVSLTLTSKDLDGQNVLKSVTLKNVPAKIARKVVYTGCLWENAGNFTVELPNDSWEMNDSIPY